MSEGLAQFLLDQGILGALVVILLGAIAYLFKLLMERHTASTEEKGEVVKALVESANASTQVANSVEKTNELLRSLITKQGGI